MLWKLKEKKCFKRKGEVNYGIIGFWFCLRYGSGERIFYVVYSVFDVMFYLFFFSCFVVYCIVGD